MLNKSVKKFTLVELLVVIAIISILAGMLLLHLKMPQIPPGKFTV